MYWCVFFSLIFGSAIGFIVALFGRNQLPCFLNYSICHAQFKEHSRPLNFASEVKSKELLFVGVMTARKYVETRARALYNTWGKQVPGRLEIFVASGNQTLETELPIKTLPEVNDNEYPPQKKVMRMLRFMYDYYVDQYEWFMRADDDVYVRSEKLEKLLRTLDSSNDAVVGQGGVGKKDEIDQLGLLKGECYCIGGPGVIMSRNVLKKMAPNIEECLKDTASTHEDVELGRCIRKFAGVSCLWAEEVSASQLIEKIVLWQMYNSSARASLQVMTVAPLIRLLSRLVLD